MQVFIVEADFGQYEDSYQLPIGCFADLGMAQAAKTIYEAQVEATINSDPPFGIEPHEYWRSDELNEEDATYYQTWEQDYNLAQDFNFCTINVHSVIQR